MVHFGYMGSFIYLVRFSCLGFSLTLSRFFFHGFLNNRSSFHNEGFLWKTDSLVPPVFIVLYGSLSIIGFHFLGWLALLLWFSFKLMARFLFEGFFISKTRLISMVYSYSRLAFFLRFSLNFRGSLLSDGYSSTKRLTNVSWFSHFFRFAFP